MEINAPHDRGVYQNGKITGFFRFKSPFGNFQTPENQAILSNPCIWFGKIEGLLIHPLTRPGWRVLQQNISGGMALEKSGSPVPFFQMANPGQPLLVKLRSEVLSLAAEKAAHRQQPVRP